MINNVLNRRPLTPWITWSFTMAIAFFVGTAAAWSEPLDLALGDRTRAMSIQPYLDRVEAQVQEFTLDNGLKFIVLENHDAPVVSFVTYADVGGVDEPEGKTGVAHFLEHLAFKGTPEIGTQDYNAEQKLLTQLDRVFDQIQGAQEGGDQTALAQLQEEFSELQNQASQYVKQNEFGQIVEMAGGVGLNAATSADYTKYFYSFPANKLELWMYLESERFLNPVLREFYKEKEVILEERRMRTENSPVGQLVEAFLDTAYQVHPYGRPVIGYTEDLQTITRQDVQRFFEAYYPPSNLTIAIVGDVEPGQVRRLAQQYFGRFPNGDKPPAVAIAEPPQTETRGVTLTLNSQPWYIEGYHRPSLDHPDDATYNLISALLSDGRTSRLYKSLVEEKQIALTAEGFSGFPGDKFPNLVVLYALTAPNHTVDEVAIAFEEALNRLKTEPVTEEDLNRVKTQAKAGLLRSLDSQMGMAGLLAEYQGKTGDWRNLFRSLEGINQVTAADIQRVAQQTFTPENKTVGRILPRDP